MTLPSPSRRAVLQAALGASLTAALPARAEDLHPSWPSKPIRLIVPYPPGGAADTVARIFAEDLRETFKQPVLVENKLGAGTAIAAELVAGSLPDGYTLSLTPTGQLTVLPHIVKNLRFDPFTSFAPVSQLAYTAVVIAAALRAPINTLAELAALAKEKPGQVSYSSSGSGTIIHLAGEYFALTADIKLLHVPFKGSAQAVSSLLSGEVDTAFDTLTILAPQIRGNKVKGIAVAAKERSPLLPTVPTVAESGYPDFEVTSWFGLIAPAGTPKAIVETINAEINAAIAKPNVREALEAQGLTPWPSTPEQFAERIRSDHAKYQRVVEGAHIKFD